MTDALNKARGHRYAAVNSRRLRASQWRQEDCKKALEDLSRDSTRSTLSTGINPSHLLSTHALELDHGDSHSRRKVHVIVCCIPRATDLGRSSEFVRIPITYSDVNEEETANIVS